MSAIKIERNQHVAEPFRSLLNTISPDVPGPKIVTRYNPKAIPLRQFDWEATEGDPDLGCLVGYGLTERQAIADLAEQIEMIKKS